MKRYEIQALQEIKIIIIKKVRIKYINFSRIILKLKLNVDERYKELKETLFSQKMNKT